MVWVAFVIVEGYTIIGRGTKMYTVFIEVETVTFTNQYLKPGYGGSFVASIVIVLPETVI